ncbi:hypothetical protein Efla_006405 [Eimeria flavescens]
MAQPKHGRRYAFGASAVVQHSEPDSHCKMGHDVMVLMARRLWLRANLSSRRMLSRPVSLAANTFVECAVSDISRCRMKLVLHTSD